MVRAAIRAGDVGRPDRLARARLRAGQPVALPEADAFDFLRFCSPTRSRARCSTSATPARPSRVRPRPGADLRTDLPATAIYRDGELVDEPTDVGDIWRDDLVAFLIGCSFTFERALLAAGLPVRHIEQGVNVPMYRTAVACRPAGRSPGPLVVSMRPMTPQQAIRATQITSRFPPRTARRSTSATRRRSGSPSLASPHYGDPVEIRDGEVPVFWACGVTPQAVAAASRPELMITHAPATCS